MRELQRRIFYSPSSSPSFEQRSSTQLQDHCETHWESLISTHSSLLSCSKTAPPASRYDEPGFPYAKLLQATGCEEGPGSFACLQRVPFEVCRDTTVLHGGRSRHSTDTIERHEYLDGRKDQWPTLAARSGTARKLHHCSTFGADRQWKFPACANPRWYQCKSENNAV